LLNAVIVILMGILSLMPFPPVIFTVALWVPATGVLPLTLILRGRLASAAEEDNVSPTARPLAARPGTTLLFVLLSNSNDNAFVPVIATVRGPVGWLPVLEIIISTSCRLLLSPKTLLFKTILAGLTPMRFIVVEFHLA
jgi:hypothetical protein